jgi:chromosome segregation ATPase
MERTASSLSGITENFSQQLKSLDAEIRADEASKYELGRLIAQLETRRDDLRARMSTNAGWSATYDKEIGPFAAK